MSSGIGDERLLDLYRVMVRIRTFENGVRQLINERSIGHMSFTGSETVAAGVYTHILMGD